MRMQVRSILGQTRPDRQTLLFSATMPTRVERLVRDALTSPVRITVGEVGAANEDVRQARPRALGNLPGVQRFDAVCASLIQVPAGRAWHVCHPAKVPND